ncbi:MAG: hypothetical protein WD648_08310 [Planctomycetaceae bacterium]
MSAVLFAPARPVFLRLAVQIDGKTPDVFRGSFCKEWFAKLDQNMDGVLDATEAGAIATTPPAEGSASQNWQQFDTAPSDSKLTPEEFRALADAALGPPIAVVKNERSADEAASLFGRLDGNQDGVLTTEELQKAREALASLDVDDDETISVGELNSAPEKTAPSGSSVADHPPILVLGPQTTSATVADHLLQYYDVKTSDSRDGALDPGELGCAPEAISPFDADGNQKLDVAELARLVAETAPQLLLTVSLFDQDRGRPSVSVASPASSSRYELKQAAADTATLGIDALEITLVARRTRSSTGDSRRYYALRFKVVDKDKNGYLDAKEFPALGLPPEATFEAVDADKNGQVVSDELVNYLSKQDAVPMNQVVMETSDVSRPLFDFLDTREDRRLSARELMSAASRLSQVDGNKDGKVTMAELTTRLGVDVSVKRPPTPRKEMAAPVRQRQGAAAVPRDRGPQWFLRMDRNYDGDVSWREFLGPRTVFDRLDADHDGLLSPDEAGSAK